MLPLPRCWPQDELDVTDAFDGAVDSDLVEQALAWRWHELAADGYGKPSLVSFKLEFEECRLRRSPRL